MKKKLDILEAMLPAERATPDILLKSKESFKLKQRIAQTAKCDVSDVNRLVSKTEYRYKYKYLSIFTITNPICIPGSPDYP